MSADERRRALRRLLDVAEDYFGDGFHADRPGEPEAEAEADARSVPGGGAPIDEEGQSPAAVEALLDAIAAEVAGCARCPLARTRKQAVPGEGVAAPVVLAVGEAPGAEEDASGRPFVGAAGQYLDKWLAAVGLERGSNAYIANVIKCRPPGNRDPQPEEVQACRGYLERQIECLRPRAILALGRHAAQALTGATQGITVLRARSHLYRGIPLVATFHPSAVLRDSSLRAPVWEDLKRLKAIVEHG